MSFAFCWTDVSEKADQDVKKIYKIKKIQEGFHLFLEGDNYPILKLLEEEYKSSIDIIYIDPPYNTGRINFVYNDAMFLGNVSSYCATDRHSAWLSFMSRRLKLAHSYLKETGCIYISIGQEELYHLKLLCDQIFGEENFVNDFMYLHGKGKKNKFCRTMQQSTLCYAKDISKLGEFVDYEETTWAKSNKDNDPRGNWFNGSISFTENRSNPKHSNYYEIKSPSGISWTRQWLVDKETMNFYIEDNRIYWGSGPSYDNVPRLKIFNGEKKEIIPKNIVDKAFSTRQAQTHLDELMDEEHIFDNPKPVNLIEHLIEITNMRKDITVMDFFAGSGTTLEAVLEVNKRDGGRRKCILIQKPEVISKQSKYKTIAELCMARCHKVLGDEKLGYYKLIED